MDPCCLCIVIIRFDDVYLICRADLLTLVCGVYCEFFFFPIGILGQVWYLIVSIPDLCTLTYFNLSKKMVAVVFICAST